MLLLKPFHRRISRSVRGARLATIPRFYFHFASGFSTPTLAYFLDSLVRVTRRVVGIHFVSILRGHRVTHSRVVSAPPCTLSTPRQRRQSTKDTNTSNYMQPAKASAFRSLLSACRAASLLAITQRTVKHAVTFHRAISRS